ARPGRLRTRIASPETWTGQVSADRDTEQRKLALSLRGELDWIVMKALEKERARRYQSAHDLGRDVQRYLDLKPLEASPPSRLYRFRKFVRRHHVATGLILCIVLLLLTVTWLSIRSAIHSRKQEALQRTLTEEKSELAREKEAERDRALHNAYLADMRVATEDWRQGEVLRLYELLDGYIPKDGVPDLRGPEWYYLLAQVRRDLATYREHTNAVRQVAWHPNGEWLASYDDSRGIVIRRASDGIILRTLEEPDHPSFAWSHDGTRIAYIVDRRHIHVWSGDSNEVVGTYEEVGQPLDLVAWSADDMALVAAWRDSISLIDVAEGTVRKSRQLAHPGDRVDWRADRPWILVGAHRLDPATVKPAVPDLVVRKAHGRLAAYNPVRPRIAYGYAARTIALLDESTGAPLAEYEVSSPIRDFAWSPNGASLAVGTQKHGVIILDGKTLSPTANLYGHMGWVNTVAWSPDGQRLASGGEGGLVKVWSAPGAEPPAEPGPETRLEEAEALPDFDGMDLGTLRAASPDGRWVVAASQANRQFSRGKGPWGVWRRADGVLMRLFADTEERPWDCPPQWAPDGSLVATCGRDPALSLWDPLRGRLVHRLRGHAGTIAGFMFLSDGRRLMSYDVGGTVKLWDVGSGREILSFSNPGSGRNPFPAVQANIWKGREIAASPGFRRDLERLKQLNQLESGANEREAEELLKMAFRNTWFGATGIPRPEKALDLVERAGSLAPQDTLFWATKGLVLIELERWEEGLSALSEAVKRSDPEPAFEVCAGMAVASFHGGRKNEVTHWAEKARRTPGRLFRGGAAMSRMKQAIKLVRVAPDKIAGQGLSKILGERLWIRGRWDEAGRELARLGEGLTVHTDWWTIGPYSADEGLSFPPERQTDPFLPVNDDDAGHEAPDHWWPSAMGAGRTVFVGSKPNASFYLTQRIWSGADSERYLHVSDRGRVKVFLNGQLLLETTSNGMNRNVAEYIRPVRLQKGWNTLLLRLFTPARGEGLVYCNVKKDRTATF
ncbi:MAG: hypothetical protein AAF492_01685, partial [Verrucomicrobiota bacterium]